jgi:uncharacterized protein
MTDQPDRTKPRFPDSVVWRVRLEVRRQFERWNLGTGDLLVCGGARGADLIAAEEALALGCGVRLCLASARDEFVEKSVELRGTAWAETFRSVAERSDVAVLESAPEATNVYEAANVWMLDEATRSGAVERFALLVWDGNAGDGKGGAGHMAALAQSAGFTVYGIDPTPRPSADRQWSSGPKRMLSLDGGGIRGVLSLGILQQIEAQLRERTGRNDLVLSDYFDYIAGTSTGAIIATALSLGKPVDEIIGQYRSLSSLVFKKNPIHKWLVSLHAGEPLRRELERFLGSGLTLGDPALKTLLMIVLHNTKTDSPWPLSNCASAKYNRPERHLNARGADRNLDLSLNDLVRGSSAAPWYFPVQRIAVGADTVPFQDGGVTPYNNPAAMLFTMATQDEYEVGWPSGVDHLLLASVGTGIAPMISPSTNFIVRRLATLPGVFMNGASISQDLLCRSLGTTTFGAPIDSEVGSLPCGRSHFAYARYNAALDSGKWLTAQLKARPGFEIEIANVDKIMSIGAKKLGKLNSIDHFDDLLELGRITGKLVDVSEQFVGH